jgi:hypothetical protein
MTRLEDFIETVKKHSRDDESWKELNDIINWIEDERKYEADPDGLIMDLMKWEF